MAVTPPAGFVPARESLDAISEEVESEAISDEGPGDTNHVEPEIEAPAETPDDTTEIPAPVVITLPPALTAPSRKGATMATNSMLDDIDPVEVGTAIATALASAQQRQAHQQEEARTARITGLATAFVDGLTGQASEPDPAAPAAPAPVAGTAVDGTGTAAPVAAPAPLRGTLAPPAPAPAGPVPPAAPPATDPTATVPTVTSDLVEGMDYDHTTVPYRVSADGVGRPWKAFAATHGGQEYIVVCFNGSDKTVGVLKAKWDINRTPAVDRARELADADAPARKTIADRLLGKRKTTK